MKRKIIIVGLMITLMCVSAENVLAAEYAEQEESINIVSYTRDARAEKIGYLYKTVNGKLYKRLYNFSRDEWIGDWILCK